jgi:hypothetical protein
MKKSFIVGFMVLVWLVFTAAAAAVDVSGTWELTSQSPRGERTSEITITQDGDTITVTMPSRRGDEITAEGRVDGNAIEWTVVRETPQGEFTMVYKGTVDGDTMKGTVEIRGNSMDWTAKKK